MNSHQFNSTISNASFFIAGILVFSSYFSEPILAQVSGNALQLIETQKDNSDLGNTGQPEPGNLGSSGTYARDWDFERDGQSQPENLTRGGSRWDFEGDGQTRSGNRNGGASRGSCPVSDRPLTALVPKINLGKTTESHPTFWFYIPDEMTSVDEAKFTLLDDENNPIIYELSIELSETSGFVSVSLPETATPLEVDREYHWFFNLQCDEDDPSKNPSVDGWIQRVEPSTGLGNETNVSLAEKPDIPLAEELAQTPDAEHYVIYANYGIWYDALTELIKQYRTQAENPILDADWLALLEAVCLEEISATPE